MHLKVYFIEGGGQKVSLFRSKTFFFLHTTRPALFKFISSFRTQQTYAVHYPDNYSQVAIIMLPWIWRHGIAYKTHGNHLVYYVGIKRSKYRPSEARALFYHN